MPKGQIIKVLAGFYYVDTGEKVVSCKARGKFRNRGQKPLVGDFCSFQEKRMVQVISFLLMKDITS